MSAAPAQAVQVEAPVPGGLLGKAALGVREGLLLAVRAMVVHPLALQATVVRLRAGRAVPENPVDLEVWAGLEADPVGRDRVVQADRLLGDPAAAGGMPLTSQSAKALRGLTFPRMEKRSGQRTRTTGLSQSLRLARSRRSKASRCPRGHPIA